MKTEDFLEMLNEIDESYIYEAGDDLEKYRYNKRIFSWKRVFAAVCAAAAMAGAVFFVKNIGDIRVGESSGVVLSEGDASMPELPIISKPDKTESDPQNTPVSYYNFSIYGKTDTGYYQFSPAACKDTDWLTPADVKVYRGNINERNSAVISVYNEDCLDYPGKSLTDYQVVDRLTNNVAQTFYLDYDIRSIDDISDKRVHLYAETGDEYVTFEGQWTP